MSPQGDKNSIREEEKATSSKTSKPSHKPSLSTASKQVKQNFAGGDDSNSTLAGLSTKQSSGPKAHPMMQVMKDYKHQSKSDAEDQLKSVVDTIEMLRVKVQHDMGKQIDSLCILSLEMYGYDLISFTVEWFGSRNQSFLSWAGVKERNGKRKLGKRECYNVESPRSNC